MKYRSPNERDRIVDELNRENARAILNPFIAIPVSMILGTVLVSLILKYGIVIDFIKFGMKNAWVGWTLYLLALGGLIWFIKRISW